MRLVSLVLVCAVSAWAGDAEPPQLPTDVQSTIDKAHAEIRKIRLQLVSALQKKQEAYTKKGNLEVAMAIKGTVDDLTSLIEQTPSGVTATLKPDQWIVGRWNLSFPGFSKVWEFSKDGTVTFSGGPTGKWTVKDAAIQVNWPSGNIEYVDIPQDLTATETTGTAGSGKRFTVVRVK